MRLQVSICGLSAGNIAASAGLVPVGSKFLHYHTHSPAASPRLAQGNEGFRTATTCALPKPCFYRGKPGGGGLSKRQGVVQKPDSTATSGGRDIMIPSSDQPQALV